MARNGYEVAEGDELHANDERLVVTNVRDGCATVQRWTLEARLKRTELLRTDALESEVQAGELEVVNV